MLLPSLPLRPKKDRPRGATPDSALSYSPPGSRFTGGGSNFAAPSCCVRPLAAPAYLLVGEQLLQCLGAVLLLPIWPRICRSAGSCHALSPPMRRAPLSSPGDSIRRVLGGATTMALCAARPSGCPPEKSGGMVCQRGAPHVPQSGPHAPLGMRQPRVPSRLCLPFSCAFLVCSPLPFSPPSFLPNFLPTFLPNFPPDSLPNFLPAFLPTFLPAFLPTFCLGFALPLGPHIHQRGGGRVATLLPRDTMGATFCAPPPLDRTRKVRGWENVPYCLFALPPSCCQGMGVFWRALLYVPFSARFLGCFVFVGFRRCAARPVCSALFAFSARSC